MELVRFDMQKIENPEISGIEYQQGELFGYEVREYLLKKWGKACAYCGKTDIPLEIEHIVPKSKGGSNRVSNLTLACIACNQKKGNEPIEVFLSNRPELLKRIEHILDVLPSERADHLTLKQRKKRYRALAGDTVACFIHPMVTRMTRHAKAMFPPKPECLGFHT